LHLYTLQKVQTQTFQVSEMSQFPNTVQRQHLFFFLNNSNLIYLHIKTIHM